MSILSGAIATELWKSVNCAFYRGRSSRDQTYRPQFCGSRTRSRDGEGMSASMQITDLITRYEHREPRKLVIREASNLFCGRISRSFAGWMMILLFRAWKEDWVKDERMCLLIYLVNITCKICLLDFVRTIISIL